MQPPLGQGCPSQVPESEPGAHAQSSSGVQSAFVGQKPVPHGVVKFWAPQTAGTHHQSGETQAAPEQAWPSQVTLVKPASQAQVPPASQVALVGHALEPQGTARLLAPHSAPQAPQSSGQLAQVSPLDVSQVPSPQVAGSVHPAQVVRIPKTQVCFRSPVAGAGIRPVVGSGGLSDDSSW